MVIAIRRFERPASETRGDVCEAVIVLSEVARSDGLDEPQGDRP